MYIHNLIEMLIQNMKTVVHRNHKKLGKSWKKLNSKNPKKNKLNFAAPKILMK